MYVAMWKRIMRVYWLYTLPGRNQEQEQHPLPLLPKGREATGWESVANIYLNKGSLQDTESLCVVTEHTILKNKYLPIVQYPIHILLRGKTTDMEG